MSNKRLNTKNKLFTPSSGTTVYIDYSEKKKVLEVGYDNGKVYQYFNVEPKVWEQYKQEVLSGGSSGRFVNFKIKPVYLKYKQL